MSLRLEPPKGSSSGSYAGIVLLCKKMYVLISPEGDTKPRGIAICRKDRISLVTTVYNDCMKVIAKYGVNDVACYFIHKILAGAMRRVTTNSCRLEEISCKKRISGNSCLVYRGIDRKDVVIEETEANAKLIVNYSRQLGTVREILAKFVVF